MWGWWALFSSPFIDWMGVHISIVVACLTVNLYLASFFAKINGLTIAAACLYGWGAALLWPATTFLIPQISRGSDRGISSGIYQAAYRAGVCVGGLIMGAINNPQPDGTVLLPNWNEQYAIFVSAAFTGMCMFSVMAVLYSRRSRAKQLWIQVELAEAAAKVTGTTTLVKHDIDSLSRQVADEVAAAPEKFLGISLAPRTNWSHNRWRKGWQRGLESLKILFTSSFAPMVPVM